MNAAETELEAADAAAYEDNVLVLADVLIGHAVETAHVDICVVFVSCITLLEKVVDLVRPITVDFYVEEHFFLVPRRRDSEEMTFHVSDKRYLNDAILTGEVGELERDAQADQTYSGTMQVIRA